MALLKLMFTTHTEADCFDWPTDRIFAHINPSSYTRSYANTFKKLAVQGDSKATQTFDSAAPEKLVLSDLIIDDTVILYPLMLTNTGTFVYSVGSYVEALKAAVYDFAGDEHRPLYVKVTWGSLVFKGVCKSFDVKYTLFNSLGIALRATVNLGLESSVDRKSVGLLAWLSSPDLTHSRTVKAGDSLSAMSNNIYKDSSYYMELARANNLNSVFDIEPGDQIYFPPIKK